MPIVMISECLAEDSYFKVPLLFIYWYIIIEQPASSTYNSSRELLRLFTI